MTKSARVGNERLSTLESDGGEQRASSHLSQIQKPQGRRREDSGRGKAAGGKVMTPWTFL